MNHSAPKTLTPRRRRWLFRGLATGLAILLGLFAAEIALRVAGVQFGDLYYPDPYCGSRLRPGYEGWFTREGRAYIRVNEHGFRDLPRSKLKPPGIFRIAVLGDSFAEALQVPLEETFWFQMQQHLKQCARFDQQTVEVLNFGVSGYGTAQEHEVLKHYVWDYQPDLVLVAFYPGNDVRSNSWKLEPEKARPFYRLRDGELVLDQSFRQHLAYLAARQYYQSSRRKLIQASRLLQLVREVKRNLGRSQPAAGPSGEAGIEDQPYREPLEVEWQEAWEITDQLLASMATMCRHRQVPMVVAVVTRGTQVHPDPSVTEQFQKRLGIHKEPLQWYPDRHLTEVAKMAGFTVVSLVQPMRQFALEKQVYLHGFPNAVPGGGHWNREGHRLAGEILARHLCDRLSSPQLDDNQ